MADTAIAITAGTGTNVDCRTEGTNGNYRQVVVVGDPATNAGVAPVDATAGLKVDLGADNDVVVSGSLTAVTTVGTVTNPVAATQSGTWTVQPGNTANTTAWKVDGSAVTQPVSGTVTSNIGTGTLSAVTTVGTVTTLTGTTTLTPGTGATNLGKAEDAAHTSGDVGVMALAVRQDSPAALAGTTGDYMPLSLDANGSLRVNITAGAGSGGTASVDDAAFTAASGSGTPIMGFVTADAVDSGDVGVVGMTTDRKLHVKAADLEALAITTGSAGTASTQVVSVQGIASMTPVAVSDGAGSLTVDGTVAATQSGTWNVGTVTAVTAISNALPAGNNNIGDVDIASIAAGDNNIGNVDIVTMPTVTVNAHAVTNAGTFVTQENGAALTALQLIDNPVIVDDAAFTPATSSVMMAGFEADETATDSVDEGDAGAARMTLTRKLIVTQQPHTAGGTTIFRSIDLDEGALEVVKASAGQVYGMWVTNTATSTRFVKFYNATSGTIGTGTPVLTIGIPGNTSDDVTGMFSIGNGIAFSTGICVGASTGVADADTGAPGTNDVIINVFYA